MKTDNTIAQTTSNDQQAVNNSNYLSAETAKTKQYINFKAQSQYQSAELADDEDEGKYEL